LLRQGQHGRRDGAAGMDDGLLNECRQNCKHLTQDN
jgi:hypothetical protein